jgi:hypothetical protein
MQRFRFFIGLCATLVAITAPSISVAQLVSITIAPPVLPVYVQPPIPEPGYIWTPGYWAYGPDGYFWVPGTWVRPPSIGLLWTPGYWGWRDGIYAWNGGYWGPHVGFYGGVNYGFGYGGIGYGGGVWRGGVFSYNTTVNNVGSVSVSTYSKTVINNTNVTNVSFNGGAGGTKVQPTAQEQAVAHEQHTPATQTQTQHQTEASSNKALLASVNHGTPAVAATSKPSEFTGKGVVAARSGAGLTNTNPAGNGAPKGPGSTPANSVATKGATPPGGSPPGNQNTLNKPVATGSANASPSLGQPKVASPTARIPAVNSNTPSRPNGPPHMVAGAPHPALQGPRPPRPPARGPPPHKPQG